MPAYGIAEAARYLKMASATLRSWTVGRSYPRESGSAFFRPLIALADREARLLSFSNLVEAHVLRGLRTEQGISIKDVRTAIKYAEKELGVDNLLLDPALRTTGRHLFLQKYGTLINLTRSGQYAMERVLEAHLRRVEWDRSVPLKLFPFVSDELDGERIIVIDPAVKAGRPILASRGISTAIIVDRVDAGEDITDLAKDYGLEASEIGAAIVYERAA